MLKTAIDFEESIQFLNAGINADTFNNFKYQTTAMDSDDFNLTMKDIESKLNLLYEKSRILEDILTYTKTFIQQNIDSSNKECRDILNDIEHTRDEMKSKTGSYMSYNIPISDSTGSYADRDRTELPHCNILDSMATLSGIINTDINIKDIKKTSSSVPYRSNIEDLKQNKAYRVYYFLDEQVSGGLEETIKVTFATPVLVNYLDIVPANCKITKITYTLSNDALESQNMKDIGIMKDRLVKVIEFDIVASLYKKETYKIDTLNMAKNYWDTTMAGSYDSVSQVALVNGNEFKTASLAEMDARFGSERVFRDYTNYLTAKDETTRLIQPQDYSFYTDSKRTISSSIASSLSPAFPLPVKVTKMYEFKNNEALNINPTTTYEFNGLTYTLWAVGSYSYLGSYIDDSGTTVYRYQQIYGATLKADGSSVLTS
jgi:hypothetical protein